MAKSTNEEVKRRVGEVSNLLITGQKRHNIVSYAAEKGWKVEARQIDEYIRRAKRLLSEEGQESKASRDVLFGISLRRIDLLFVKSMAIQDYARALAAQKEINTLLALYEPQIQKIDHTTKGEKIGGTDEERLARLAGILDTIRDRRDRSDT
ncbi:MAG TPA: hypothetical protein ENI05_14055 [Porticoccus sp.]|nr:hypothetical protein [Porticoccus sp.]